MRKLLLSLVMISSLSHAAFAEDAKPSSDSATKAAVDARGKAKPTVTPPKSNTSEAVKKAHVDAAKEKEKGK